MTYYFGTPALRHFGDNLVALDLLKRMARKFGFESEYAPHMPYVGEWGFQQLQEFVADEPRVSLAREPHPDAADLWVLPWVHGATLPSEYPMFPMRYITGQGVQDIFEMWFVYGNEVCKRYGLPSVNESLTDVLFEGEPFIGPINKTLPHPVDIILVNSYGGSEQMWFTPEQQDAYFTEFARYLTDYGFSFITTHKIDGFPCTQDSGMSLVDIGKLAVNCKTVVGVPTAPFLMTLNKAAFHNTKYINMSHHTPVQGSLYFNLGVYNIPAGTVSLDIIRELL